MGIDIVEQPVSISILISISKIDVVKRVLQVEISDVQKARHERKISCENMKS
jgi:hypothetical protein